MAEWEWTEKTAKNGRTFYEGISPWVCAMIHMSGYKRGFTSTTIWRPGGRFETDHFLKGEKFTSLAEARGFLQRIDTPDAADRLFASAQPKPRTKVATTKKAEVTPLAPPEEVIRCTFCGKSQYEVEMLIAGGTALICDECIDACHTMAHRRD